MPRQPLLPGQSSIKSAKPYPFKGAIAIAWRGCLPDGTLITSRTQAATVGEARARAFATFEDKCRACGTDSSWTLQMKVVDFIDRVTIPEIERKRLSERTKERYLEVIQLYRARVGAANLQTQTKVAPVKKILHAISVEVGYESSRQTRSVVSGYLIDQMVEHGLIDHNPIKGLTFDFTRKPAAVPDEEDQINPDEPLPTVAEWKQLLNFILHEEDSTAPMPGKTSAQAKKRGARLRHARVMQLTALQMVTGLRISEARRICWKWVTTDEKGVTWIFVPKHVAKNGRARTVPILNPEVAAQLVARRGADTAKIIPQPTSDYKTWDRGGAQNAVLDYYLGLVETQGFNFLKVHRSHVWRQV